MSRLHKASVSARRFVPEQGQRFVAAAGDQGHLNAFASDLVTVQAADGTDGLSQVRHLDGGLQLIICVRAELHSFHLDTIKTINEIKEQNIFFYYYFNQNI